MAELFDEFPYLENDKIIIRKMVESDVEALEEITSNDNVYRFIPPFLHNKSRGNLLAAIKNLGGRDFEKKKLIIAGVYRKDEPERLIGLAEMFDCKKKQNMITIGYRINESYWHKGIAGNIILLMREYLTDKIGIGKLQAFVMPENVYSAKALLKNGFIKEDGLIEEENWGGQEKAFVEKYVYTK